MDITKRLLTLIPVTPFTTFFWIGKIKIGRFIILPTVSFILALSFGYSFHSLVADKGDHIEQIGTLLLLLSIILFIIGTIFIFLYNLRRSYDPDEIIITEIFGRIFTLVITLPILEAIRVGLITVYNVLCKEIFLCPQGTSEIIAIFTI